MNPNDYVIVPKVPTDEMKAKIKETAAFSVDGTPEFNSIINSYDTYQSAIKAAPKHNFVIVTKEIILDALSFIEASKAFRKHENETPESVGFIWETLFNQLGTAEDRFFKHYQALKDRGDCV